ncbi:MAG: NUDIX hydrolase [Anaerolineales bacterium]|nr:NUDIX hydrolase [Anaerolineales bacterium]
MTQINHYDPLWSPVRLRSAVYVEKNGQVLLVYDPIYRGGCWTLPGGGVDFAETVNQAAEREVQEETGIKIVVSRIWRLREIWEKEQDFQSDIKIRRTMELIFVGEYIGGDINYENDPSLKPDGIARVKQCRWIKLDSLGNSIDGSPIYPVELFNSNRHRKLDSIPLEIIMLPSLDLR